MSISHLSITVSLTSSRRTISTSMYWAAIFDERIYQICNIAHPGLPIDYDAVEHIRYFLQSIVSELIEARSTSVDEVKKAAEKLFANGLIRISEEAQESMNAQFPLQPKQKGQKPLKSVLESQYRLTAVIKESLGLRDRDQSFRGKKKIERLACYIYYVCEAITEDILRYTGNYVKNFRDKQRITMANLDAAMNDDRAFKELRTKLPQVRRGSRKLLHLMILIIFALLHFCLSSSLFICDE